MRQFFITSFERLMNVMVVLTGLAILALAGKMAMNAQGDSERLLHAALVLLGGFVALITFAGSAYLAIANHKSLRRMATLVETGGRAAKPLTASRSRELPARRVIEPAYDEPADEAFEAAPAAPATPPVRHAPVMRAAKQAPVAAPVAHTPPPVAKPAFTRQPPVMRAQPEAATATAQQTQPPVQPQIQPRAQTRAMEDYGRHQQPAFAPQEPEPAVQYAPEPVAAPVNDYAPAQIHDAEQAQSGVFSGRGMPKLRGAAPQPEAAQAPSPVFSQPAFAPQPPVGNPQNHAPQTVQPVGTPAQNSGRLVADRRPLR